MHTTFPQQPFLYLAPIRGITDALFREILVNHFNGFDAAIAPFINPQEQSPSDDKLIRDILPEHNPNLPVIPQLLHNKPEPFLILAQRLTDLGFTHINWNLGCPAPMIAKKQRGSGLLPHPEKILHLLDNVLPKLTIELSIKTRLGFHSHEEIIALLPQLNQYPLKEIILHTRLGKQLYKGKTDPDGFAMCQKLSKHPFVYNGDINDPDTYNSLATRFHTTDRWMIGRGALANPMLAEQIKGIEGVSNLTKLERLQDFHKELFARYQKRLSGPSHILGRLKLLWSYLILSFPGHEKQLKKIQKSHTIEQYSQVIEQLFKQAKNCSSQNN